MDYKKIGLKAGLEVHQQLDTGKLFCRCKTILRDEAPDLVTKRFMRVTSSELGEMDQAAVEEFRKKHAFFYESFFDTTCEVELDEAPPKSMDKNALETVLEIALLTNSRVFEKIVVMRKIVIDGSNTSGFQRTALVAMNGKIKAGEKTVGVQTIAIEEDSARPSEKKDGEVTYRLDRLGTPLIELATAPELFTPLEVKQAALEIGKIFRLTGKTKRGLGTIRQDINVSITGGQRIEVKGVQDLQNIDKVVEREAQRQASLLEIKAELEKRGCTKQKILENKMIPLGVLENPKDFLKGKKISGIRLPFFTGLIGKEIQPLRRLGTEFADHVRKKTKAKGIMHSDENLEQAYEITEKEKQAFAQALGTAEKDAFVLVAENDENKAREILEETVLFRAAQCLEGVPKETREALEDGNSSYLRPIPGAARMYPETDLEPISVEKETLEKIKNNLPRSEGEREKIYTKWGLSGKLAGQMKLNNHAPFFEELVKKGFSPTKTAVFLLETLVEAKRLGAKTDNLSREQLQQFMEKTKAGEIKPEVETELLKEFSQNPGKSIGEIISGKKIEHAGDAEVLETVKRVFEKNRQLVEEKGQAAFSGLMGDAMRELKGKASGKQVSDALRKILGENKK